LKDNAIADEGA